MVIKNFICNIHRTFAPDISSVCPLCIMYSVQTDDVFSWTYIQTNNYKTDVYNEINPEQRNKPHRRRPQKSNRWQKRTIYQAAGTTREIGTNHGEHPQWHRATGVYPLHRWNVPPSAPAMLPHSLPVLFPASVSLASLPVFPVFSTTFSTACTVAWTILGSALCYAPDILFRAAWKA